MTNSLDGLMMDDLKNSDEPVFKNAYIKKLFLTGRHISISTHMQPQKVVLLPNTEYCPICGGMPNFADPCANCKNTGMIPKANTSQANTNQANTGQICEICSSRAKLQCSRCKKKRYCGKDCQKKDWTKKHKQTCAAKI